MRKRPDNFFTDDEKKRIESAIHEAESGTSGEIVAMVVDRSDHYRDVDVFVSMLLSACAAVYPAELVFIYAERILYRFTPAMGWMGGMPDTTKFMTGLLAFLVITLMFYLPVRYIIGRMPTVRRFFISIERRDAEVRERALSEFREHGLDKTRDATGMLFLISLFEKRVYVIADHGIYGKIRQETLDTYAERVSRGLKANRGAESLCEAIRSAGQELSRHFPRMADDVNELPDSLVTE